MPIGPQGLGLDPNSGEKDLFRWFLATLLFGKPIQQTVAKRAWEAFMHHGVDTPQKILDTGWRGLVDILGEGHYRRYDESTATYLLATMRLLLARYQGKVTEVLASAKNVDAARSRLQQFKGVGPKTAGIFLEPLDANTLIGVRGHDEPMTLSREDLGSETSAELHERARALRIHDHSRMSKDELVESLAPFYAAE